MQGEKKEALRTTPGAAQTVFLPVVRPKTSNKYFYPNRRVRISESRTRADALRQDKRNIALAGAEDCIRDMEQSLEEGHSPHKPTFKKEKLRGAFYLDDLPAYVTKAVSKPSSVQLTVLRFVSKNDYTTNLNQMGIKTNYRITKSITSDGRFLAIEVHNVMKNPLMVHVFYIIHATSAFVATVSEGTVDIPNRFRIVDRPLEKRPPRHKSGRRYKRHSRYPIRTRTTKLEHEPPEGFKRYKPKPWKQRTLPPPASNTFDQETGPYLGHGL
ncbi:MAG: hypothetical protein JOS17DRAFT_776920 [Linnemannia elongata]|nr:MAG: hypothetical protein JOS17DRAFT_776920 [Linnemannia elongata]